MSDPGDGAIPPASDPGDAIPLASDSGDGAIPFASDSSDGAIHADGPFEQLQGVVGALSGQVIVLLAQNRALQQLMVEKGVCSAVEVRETTLAILDRELDDLADQILPAELSTPVKATLRQAIAAARE